jgi:hypothetical protein
VERLVLVDQQISVETVEYFISMAWLLRGLIYFGFQERLEFDEKRLYPLPCCRLSKRLASLRQTAEANHAR